MEYLRTTWIVHKEKFVTAFTNLVLHLGHLATSRAEGNHSLIKGWISVSSGDLKDVYEKISLSIDYQEHHICQQIIYNNTHSMLAFSHIIWKDVKRKISHYALYKVYEKFQKAKHLAGDSTCSSIFRSTMGLPCSHELNRLIGNNFSLGAHRFHRHWWLVKPHEPECNDSDTSADAMTDFADALTQLQS